MWVGPITSIVIPGNINPVSRARESFFRSRKWAAKLTRGSEQPARLIRLFHLRCACHGEQLSPTELLSWRALEQKGDKEHQGALAETPSHTGMNNDLLANGYPPQILCSFASTSRGVSS